MPLAFCRRLSMRISAPVVIALSIACSRSPAAPRSPAPEQRLAVTQRASPANAKLDSIKPLPWRVSPASGGVVRVVICQSNLRSRDHPPIWVLDGVVLGLRADGTIDHDAAGKAMREVDVKSITFIQILEDATAIARFGPGAHQGVVLVETLEAKKAAHTKARTTRAPLRAPYAD
jgi:hypothetical protein